MAERLGNVIQNVQADQQLQQTQEKLMEQQCELAINEERQRMARDLHDSLSQSIHSMVLFSETLGATLEKKNFERAAQIMERLRKSARQSHKETRLLLYQLQAEAPESSVDLVRDLEERLAKVERHTGVKTQVVQDGSLECVPLDWHKNLFWIAIEALNNALKHAQARNEQVLLRCSPEYFEMEIKDDGIGFETTKVGIGGLGLGNMHARADIIDGKLTIQSKPGGGTIVRFVGDPRGCPKSRTALFDFPLDSHFYEYLWVLPAKTMPLSGVFSHLGLSKKENSSFLDSPW